MRTLVQFSLRQKVFFNLLFVFLIIAGAFSLANLPTERYPNVNFGEVIVSTSYPGASPVDVELLVTRKIEEVLETIRDVDWISATSFRGRSHIRMKFVDDADYDALYNEVRFSVMNMLGELPDDIDPPFINSATVEDFLPVIVINLVGDHDNRALALMAEKIKAHIRGTAGVKEIQMAGEYVREFHVHLSLEKMNALGVTYDEVIRVMEQKNLTIPAGDFSDASGEFVVRADEKFRDRDDITRTIIRSDGDGSYVRIGDVINYAERSYRDRAVIASVNGQSSLALKVIKTDAGNALDIKREVLSGLNEMEAELREEGVELVITQDSTLYIRESLGTMTLNMLAGIFLVSLLIWYFMGWRNAGIITVGIPFSFMITMVIMYLTGNSLNEISLFALVLVTGIIVDDAIVVTENIYRHVQEGHTLRNAIVNGTAEVALPVVAATMTTVAAFMPMLIMSGSTGEFFAQIPKVVSFAIVASLIECLIILPIHYFDFGPGKTYKAPPHEVDNGLMRVLRRWTESLLALTMRYRLRSVLLVVLAFVVSVVILGLSASGRVSLIRIQFFPDDYTIYYADVEGPSSTAVEVMDVKVREMARFILQEAGDMARSASSFAGFNVNDDYEQVFGSNRGTVMVSLPPKDEIEARDSVAHLDHIRVKIKERFEQDGFRIKVHAQKDGPPQGMDINVRVIGSNPDDIDNLARDLLVFMQQEEKLSPYLVDLSDDRGLPKRVLRFRVKDEQVREYQLDNAQVLRLAASVLDGRYIGKFRLTDEEVDLKVYVDPAELENPQHALYVPFTHKQGGSLYLGDLVDLVADTEPGELNRYQGQRAISIKANLKADAPIASPAVIHEVKQYYETIRKQYPGAQVIFGGEHEATQRSYESLAMAFIIAVMVMYVILAAQFQSYLQPMIILSAIVFALIGVVLGKLFTQSLFTVNSFIAVIGVAGVVVNDALVLIDFMNKSYRRGMDRKQAVREGVRIRLRPITLTTLTTSLGLLPMAIGIPRYSLVWGTMASTFVTGLAMATALTLFIVPVLWDLLQGFHERRDRPSERRIEPEDRTETVDWTTDR